MSEFVNSEEVFDKYPIIQRKQYADYLTNFLNQQGENGYVLNLNSEWGAGKTTFLKCWYNELKKDHPVIYFDAWTSDFTHDAMTALIDCFHAQLANPLSDNQELIKSFFLKGSHFVKKALPSLIAGYAKHKTGIVGDESLVEDITTTLGVDIADKDCGDALKDVLKEILEQRKKVEGINEFKTVLEELAKAYIEVSQNSENPNKYPVYVFIDELDRCRPNYAIEIIECVKHFFNTKNFVFVIATDSEQLQHSIKAVYGSGFDANIYLSRFFNLSVTLPPPELKQYIMTKFERLDFPSFPNDISKLNYELVIDLIESIFTYHGIISLREVDKILLAIDSYRTSTTKRINILSLLILTILNKFHPEFYNKLKKQKSIPYNTRNAVSTAAMDAVSNKTAVAALKFVNDSYQFEYFLNDCVRESFTHHLSNIDTVEKWNALSSHNNHLAYQGLISHIVFNQDGDVATPNDYIALVDLSFIVS